MVGDDVEKSRRLLWARVKKEERTTGETRRVEEEGADACMNDRRPTSTRRITTPSSI